MEYVIIQRVSGQVPDKVDCLIIPDGTDLEAEKEKLRAEYPPNQCRQTLADWLLAHGSVKCDCKIVYDGA